MHHTILVYNECLSLFGSLSEATSFVDIPLPTLTIHIGNRIGELHVTGNLHCRIVLWHIYTVAFTKDDIIVAAGISQGFVKFYTDSIGSTELHFVPRNRVTITTIHTITDSFQDSSLTLAFLFTHLTDETSALDISV